MYLGCCPCGYNYGTLDEILDLHGCKINVKQILSKDDVKSTVNVVKPGFPPFVSVNIKFHCLEVNIKLMRQSRSEHLVYYGVNVMQIQIIFTC